MTWKDAEQKCQQVNGHLASIHSIDENNFIYGMTGNSRVWLGATHIKAKDRWVWSDDTIWNHENWDSNEPSNAPISEDEHCLTKQIDGRWNGYGCNNTLQFVCESDTINAGLHLRSR